MVPEKTDDEERPGREIHQECQEAPSLVEARIVEARREPALCFTCTSGWSPLEGVSNSSICSLPPKVSLSSGKDQDGNRKTRKLVKGEQVPFPLTSEQQRQKHTHP
ncbi:uncharacterized protein LOC111552309 [Piliocolobus tephrosceles]|uniref:uncharacterized protein LOC111552309 n=1 Tax=Piliocolobus tephrosceles TaxID=591936 RepID=UPI000C297D35|nr:uncharacterized protein LOC111552309 [Piliocolobus tephrosceles]